MCLNSAVCLVHQYYFFMDTENPKVQHISPTVWETITTTTEKPSLGLKSTNSPVIGYKLYRPRKNFNDLDINKVVF